MARAGSDSAFGEHVRQLVPHAVGGEHVQAAVEAKPLHDDEQSRMQGGHRAEAELALAEATQLLADATSEAAAASRHSGTRTAEVATSLGEVVIQRDDFVP
jgi:hypothetical protein